MHAFQAYTVNAAGWLIGLTYYFLMLGYTSAASQAAVAGALHGGRWLLGQCCAAHISKGMLLLLPSACAALLPVTRQLSFYHLRPCSSA